MSLFQVTTEKLKTVPSTTFTQQGMFERQDLQRLLRADISPLGDDLIVIAEEYGNWEDSKRRIDLLCMDKQAQLVVVEIKRTEDGGHMELQAIRYAAMVSGITLGQAMHSYAKMLGGDAAEATAEANILAFLGVDTADDIEFGGDVRIILVAGDFSIEITTAVMWLNKHDLDITCFRLTPYRVGELLLVDVTQIIPLPEAAEFEVKIRAQAQEAKKIKTVRQEIFKRFWQQLIDRSKATTHLFANKTTTSDHWISASIGKAGFTLTLSLSKDRARIECYIKLGRDEARAEYAFKELILQRQQIESVFGEELDWQDLPGRMGCRICKDLHNGWQAEEEAWPQLQLDMIEHLMRLEKALKGPIQSLTI